MSQKNCQQVSQVFTRINKIISSKDSLTNLVSSSNFFYFFCLLIFFISIFIRSRIDIGPDTAIYIELGKKMFNGDRYYYDFYESNMPISFYFYAWQYAFAQATGISSIIVSEIFSNVFGLAAILLAARILKKTTIYDNKAYYHLIIISYFIGYFIRNPAIIIGEYGTKTSLFLMFAYPYISFCFERKIPFSKKELLLKGLLMATLPAIKPSYIALVVIIEIYNFLQSRKLKFFFEIDKLAALLIGLSYLLFMWIYTREYFTYMVPMWSISYPPYQNAFTFFAGTFKNIPNRLVFPCFLFLVFLYKKIKKDDIILILAFLGAYINLVLETGISNDQLSTYYSILIIIILKFSYDFLTLEESSFSQNKFIFLLLFLVPEFDYQNFFAAFFGISNIWWIIVPISFVYLLLKIKFKTHYSWLKLVKEIRLSNVIKVVLILGMLIIFSITLICAIPYGSTLSLNGGGDKKLSVMLQAYTIINICSFLISLYFFEKLHKKFFKKFSLLGIVTVISIISSFICGYMSLIFSSSSSNSWKADLDQLSYEVAKYSEIYAPKQEDRILLFSGLSVYVFPLVIYLDRDTNYKAYSEYFANNTFVITDDYKNKQNEYITSPSDKIFVHRYFYNNLIHMLKNADSKVILVDNSFDVKAGKTCAVNQLEIMFGNSELTQIFFKNFKYAGHILTTQEYPYQRPSFYLFKHHKDIFDSVKSSDRVVLYDFEVYVRR